MRQTKALFVSVVSFLKGKVKKLLITIRREFKHDILIASVSLVGPGARFSKAPETPFLVHLYLKTENSTVYA